MNPSPQPPSTARSGSAVTVRRKNAHEDSANTSAKTARLRVATFEVPKAYELFGLRLINLYTSAVAEKVLLSGFSPGCKDQATKQPRRC